MTGSSRWKPSCTHVLLALASRYMFVMNGVTESDGDYNTIDTINSLAHSLLIS